MDMINKKIEKILNILKNPSESYDLSGKASIGKMTGNYAVGSQANFYSNKIFIPLKFEGKKEITILAYRNIFNNFKLFSFSILTFIFIFASIFLAPFGVYKNIFLFVNSIIYMFLIGMFIYLVAFFILKLGYKRKLMLTEKMLIIKNDNQMISYKEIRSIVKKSNFLSYSLYIYKRNEIFPYIQFDVDSMHEANAIYELITNNIINNYKD